jgi:hypothetical protein
MTTTYQRVYTSGTLGAISATQGSGTEVTEARNTTASGDPETGYALVYLDEAFVDTV